MPKRRGLHTGGWQPQDGQGAIPGRSVWTGALPGRSVPSRREPLPKGEKKG